jgi:hypothetical protein
MSASTPKKGDRLRDKAEGGLTPTISGLKSAIGFPRTCRDARRTSRSVGRDRVDDGRGPWELAGGNIISAVKAVRPAQGRRLPRNRIGAGAA